MTLHEFDYNQGRQHALNCHSPRRNWLPVRREYG